MHRLRLAKWGGADRTSRGSERMRIEYLSRLAVRSRVGGISWSKNVIAKS